MTYRQFVTTAPTPLPGQRAAISNGEMTFRDRIERAIETAIAQALAEHEAAQPLDSADDFAALSAKLANAQARIAAHARPGAGGGFKLPAGDSPARSGPAGITNQFRLPAGDDDSMTQATPSTNARATAGAGGFLLPK